jgi:hypothetical protein
MMILSQPGRALLMFLTIAFSPALCLGQVIELTTSHLSTDCMAG